MAQWKNQVVPPPIRVNNEDPFAAMGKPIPFYAKQAGYEHARDMGLNEHDAYAVVNGMSEQLERDQPYEAQGVAMKYLDLTGTYRLMAAILAAAVTGGRDAQRSS